MVNICVICMACNSLEPLSHEHRAILEQLISTAVNLEDLRKLKLLVCSACLSLIKALAEFQNTAINGVKHLLRLSQNKMYEPEEVLIKDEPPDIDNSVDTAVEIEIEPECEIQLLDEIKSEETDWNSIEDVTPKSTIQAQDSRQAPMGSQSEETDIFTHSKTVQSNAKPQTQTKNVPAFPTIPFVPQHQSVTAQCPPLQFFNPQFIPTTYHTLNMPTFLPVSMQNVLTVAMPPLQKISLDSKEPKNMEERNPESKSNNNSPETSTGKMKKRANVLQNKAKPIAAENIIPSPTATKPLDERKPESRTNNNKTEEKKDVVIKWHTRVFTRHQMFMQRAKERARPEFAGAPYKCNTCILLFGSQEEMDAHVNEHELPADQLPCKACAMPVRASDESAHETRHMTRLQCARCAFSTEYLNVIEAHDCSSQPAKRIRDSRKYPTAFKCEFCNTRYSDKAGLIAHNQRAHKTPEVHKCDVCSKEFPGKVQRSMHMRNSHKSKDNAIDALRPELYCAECNKAFATASQYRQHRMTRKHRSKNDWNFQCDMCNKKFLNRGDIIYHIRWKHNEESQKSYVCAQCGKCARSPFRLRLHMQAHVPLRERPRPHVCHLCGKAFLLKKTLEEHMLKHSGLRPFACPLCPATFTYSSALFTHNQLKHLKIKRNLKKRDEKVQKRKKDKSGNVRSNKDVSEANT